MLNCNRGQSLRGLVNQYQARRGHEGPADSEHLLLASRQTAPGLAAALAQTRKRFIDSLDRRANCLLVFDHGPAKAKVFLDGEMRKDRPALQYVGHSSRDSVLGFDICDVLPVEDNRP